MPPSGQDWKQAPQWAARDVVSTHSPPQLVSRPGHCTGGATQVPPKQPSDGPQTKPQPPQLFRSMAMSMHTPPQSVSPERAQCSANVWHPPL
jgi:hypothetical protein